MTNDQILDRIYMLAVNALTDMHHDMTVSAGAWKALRDICDLSLEVPTTLPEVTGKYEKN